MTKLPELILDRIRRRVEIMNAIEEVDGGEHRPRIITIGESTEDKIKHLLT